MSTRCCITVETENKVFNYYHHSDGYIMGVGKELVDFLIEGTSSTFLWEWKYKERQLPRSYEPEECLPEEHGDIEYVYKIVEKGNRVDLTVYIRKDWEKDTADNWREWNSITLFKTLKREGNEYFTNTLIHLENK